MATNAGTGFVAGLKAGGGLVSQALENERLDAKERRDLEEHEYKQGERKRVSDAWGEYEKANAPKVTDAGLQVAKDVYGQTPEQAAGPAGAAQRAAGDVPDSYDLQNVPARTGLPEGSPVTPAAAASPFARTAADVGTAAPSRLQQEQAMQGLSTKLRDVQGIRASQESQRKIQFDDTLSGAMKAPIDEIKGNLGKLNLNQSAYPMLYTGKGKGGYTTLSTIDPQSGEPQKDYKFTDPQLRQIYAAQKLADAGFGEQSLKMLTDVDKSLGEHFKSWNEATNKAATTTNTALHYANSDEQDRARTGIAASNAARQANQDKINNSKYFIDPKTGENYITMPTMGKDGIKVQTFQLNNDGSTGKPVPLPPGAQPVGSSGKKGDGLKEFPERGKVMQDSQGNTVKSDGVGGYINVNGWFKDEAPDKLTKQFGFSAPQAQKMAENLSPEGTEIWWNGNKYPLTRDAMTILKGDMERDTRQQDVAAESAKRVATAPTRRAAREDVAGRMDTVNLGLRLPGSQDARDRYLNTDE